MAHKKKQNADWRKEKRGRDGSIYEADGRIYARLQFIGEDGKRKDKKRLAQSRTHARELLKELRDELKNHGEITLNADRIRFQELAAKYGAWKLQPAVIVNGRKVAGVRSLLPLKSAMNALTESFGRKYVRSIKHSDIEAYRLERLHMPTKDNTARSIASVNRELELLRAVLRYAQREGWIIKSPFEMGEPLISKVSETKRERVLTYEEESRLLASCTKRRAHLRPLLTLALDTGMRRGELFKLQWSDVDLTARLIRVRATTTKTETARTVGLTPRSYNELTILRAIAPPTDGLVFGIYDTIKTAFLSACRDAEIEGFRFHDCRHTAITRMVEAGMPAAEVMKISGHTQMTTFARYVNVNEQAARRGAELLAAHVAREQTQTMISIAIN